MNTELKNKNLTSNYAKPILAEVLTYIKSKISEVEQMQNEALGADYNHSNFFSGLWNAYEDLRFEIEEGSFKDFS